MHEVNDNLLTLERKWYVLYTRTQLQFKAEEQLKELNIDTYLPTHHVFKKWSDRKKKVLEPVFKGYIFINATEKERIYATAAPAVIKCVFFDGKPAVIQSKEMESLKSLLTTHNEELVIANYIEIGKKVKIIRGPLEGVEGVVLISDKHGQRLGITVELLQRTVSVHLSSEHIIVNDE